MMKRLLLPAAIVAAVLSGPVAAAPITYTALLSGSAEFPPNASPGTGFATVIYDADAHTLEMHVSFSGLTGTTTAAHIHCCTAVAETGTAGVATTTPNFVGFPLTVSAGTFDDVLDLTLASSFNSSFITANGGLAGAEARLAAGLAARQAYFNIHTSTFGGGEIRGFLVPEPGVLSLFGIGFAGVLAARRRTATMNL